jgi:hypothetical protein
VDYKALLTGNLLSAHQGSLSTPAEVHHIDDL